MQALIDWSNLMQQNRTPLASESLPAVGQALLSMLGPLQGKALEPAPERLGGGLPRAWVQAWANYLLRQAQHAPQTLIAWIHLSEIPEVVLFHLVQQLLPHQPVAAQTLAHAIHPLNKVEYSGAMLELALASQNPQLMRHALRSANAHPIVAEGAEECQALGQALVRLSRSPLKPDHPDIRAAHTQLIELAATRVEKDVRSFEILPTVLHLICSEQPGWWQLAPPLVARLHTASLRLEGELALWARFSGQTPLPAASSARLTPGLLGLLSKFPQLANFLDLANRPPRERAQAARLLEQPEWLDPSEACYEVVEALLHFGRHDQARELAPRAGLEALILVGENSQALRQMAKLPSLQRLLALQQLGSKLSLEQQLDQLLQIPEDSIRHRCAAELAARRLADLQLDQTKQLLEQALLTPPQVSLLDPIQQRDLQCRVWLQRGEIQKVLAQLRQPWALDPSGLALLRQVDGGPLTSDALQELSQKAESFFSGGNPPSDECVGASLAHLINDGDESKVAAFFRHPSDPQRKALGSFLRERAARLGCLPWKSWAHHFQQRGRPCPLVLRELAPQVVSLPEAQLLIDALTGSDTNSQEALRSLARAYVHQGQDARCWQIAERLATYPRSTLCEDLMHLQPAERLVEVLQALPRKGLDANTKEIIERRLAQAELLAGRPKSAWKTLPKLGKANPVAAAQLAESLGGWLEQHPREVTAERVEELWKALGRCSSPFLARHAPRLIGRWLALRPSRTDLALGLAAVMETAGDRALIHLCPPLEPEPALELAEQPGKHDPITLGLALQHPQFSAPQKARFLVRLSNLHPNSALHILRELLSRPDLAARQPLAYCLQHHPYPGELQRKATLLWAEAVLLQSHSPRQEWLAVRNFPGLDAALARDLVSLASF